METIYAARVDTPIWSDRSKIHKAGKVPIYEPLTVINQYSENWFSIERPVDISLPADPLYPNYWAHLDDVILALPGEDPGPIPDPDPNPIPAPEELVTDKEVALAILTILRWYKQGLVNVSFIE
jgi:hypothetical protein